MAFVDPRTFGINLYIIIGAVLLLALLFVVIIFGWTALKTGIWQLGRSRAARRETRRKLQPDGQPYPPAAQGLCDRCRRSCDLVYHLPAGERRCPACYERLLEERQ